MTGGDDEAITRITRSLSRRELFRAAGLAAGGAALAGLPGFLTRWTGAAEAAEQRSYGSAMAGLELDGQVAAFLHRTEGGNPVIDVVAEGGPDLVLHKRPGQVRSEDILLDVALTQVSKPLAGWIGDTLVKGPMPKNGALVFGDLSYKEIKRLEFSNAVITEVSTPKCDGASKDQAMLTLRITPQTARFAAGTGKLLNSPPTKSTMITSSAFRFNVQGLENACHRVAKVERVVARRSIRPDGGSQALDCSVVSITMPEMDGGPFYAWLEEAMKGKQASERAGLLQFLDPSLKNVGATVQFGGLGMMRYAPDPIKAGSTDKGGMVQIDMYCETMNLSV